MSEPVGDRGPSASRGGRVPQVLLLAGCAAAIFLGGRFWSLREVREAQRAAGLAEEGRLKLEAELIECRNAQRIQQGRGGPGPEGEGRGRDADPSRTAPRPATVSVSR
jgi:hypothetical protein